MVDRPQQAADVIAGLSGATPNDARQALDEFSVKDQTAALAVRGGGGSQPHTHEQLATNPAIAIPDNDFAVMTWDQSFGPDTLLDITTPTLPEIVADGIYAFAVTIRGSDITTGGHFIASLELDPDGEDYFQQQQSPNKATDVLSLTLCATLYLTAGMVVKVVAESRDGAAATGNFSLAPALVQRVG